MNSSMRHDLKRCIRETLGIAGFGLCVMLFLVPFSTAGIPSDSIFDVTVTHMQMKFRFIGDGFLLPVQIFTVLFGFVFGLFSFRFVLDRSRAATYFSLGLRRESLYAHRFLVGAVLIALSILIPILISLALNLAALGAYQGMFAAAVYLWSGLLTTALVSFAVAAIACLLAGTLPEAVFFSVSLLALPYTVCAATGIFLKQLLWGNPFGVLPYLGDVPLAPAVADRFSTANPVVFFFKELESHRMFYRPLQTEFPEPIVPTPVVVWFVIALALALLGLVCMKKRRAEQAGFSGKQPWATRCCLLVPLLFLCAVTFDFAADVNLLFGSLVLVVVFILCVLFGDRMLLHESYRSMFQRGNSRGDARGIRDADSPKKRQSALGYLLVRVLLLLVFVLGAKFGYGAYMSLPAETDISSVRVSYAGSPNLIGVTALGSSTTSNYYYSASYAYETPEDIASAQNIHRTIAADGKQPLAPGTMFADTSVPYDLCFTYTLKNGKMKSWYYDRASFAELNAMLALDESDSVRAGIAAAFGGSSPEAPYVSPAETLWAREAYTGGDIYLADATYRNIFSLRMSDDDRRRLLACMEEDMLNQTVAERYFPAGMPLGVLMFTFDSEHDLSSFSYHLNNSFFYVDGSCKNTLSFLNAEGLWFPDAESTRDSAREAGTENKTASTDADDARGKDDMAGSAFTTIDPDEVDSLIIQDYDPYIGINKPNFPQALYFMSYLSERADDFRIQKDFGVANEVRDPQQKELILSEMRSTYFLSEPGSLVSVKYRGGDRWVYYFWPG